MGADRRGVNRDCRSHDRGDLSPVATPDPPAATRQPRPPSSQRRLGSHAARTARQPRETPAFAGVTWVVEQRAMRAPDLCRMPRAASREPRAASRKPLAGSVTRQPPPSVIPAKAGISCGKGGTPATGDPSLRWGDVGGGARGHARPGVRPMPRAASCQPQAISRIRHPPAPPSSQRRLGSHAARAARQPRETPAFAGVT